MQPRLFLHRPAATVLRCLPALIALAPTAPLQAAPYAEFDARLFGTSLDQGMDLSRFAQGSSLEPGEYLLDVEINQQSVGRHSVRMVKDGQQTVPCLSTAQLAQWHVRTEELDADAECLALENHLPGAAATVDAASQTLRLSIPQAWLRQLPRGYVSPAQWDQGISAGFVNYNLNSFQSGANDLASQRSYFGSVNAGLNLGAWRLRSDATYNHDESAGGRSTLSTLYAQRNVVGWRSQLTAGRAYTPGDLFNSFQFTGVRLGSDERMRPDSQNGFAPVVKGLAETQARVSVYQAGTKIHELSVAPGPFVIDDLYNTGYGGDLEVVIEEADGQQKRFTVPYANIARLVRPGQFRYDFSVGQYYQQHSDFTPAFGQGSYQVGVSNLMTLYTGALVAEGYYAGIGGMAFNTPVGALSLDLTHSDARHLDRSVFDGEDRRHGDSLRLAYSTTLRPSNTNIALAAYRFSSRGYLDFVDYARLNSGTWGAFPWFADGNVAAAPYALRTAQRNRLQVSLNQPLGHRSTLFASGSLQDYWDRGAQRDLTYQAGYSTAFNWGSLNVSASRTQQWMASSHTALMASVNVPLGGNRRRAATLSNAISYGSDQTSTLLSSVQGSGGDHDQLSYQIYTSMALDGSEREQAGGASAQYAGRHAQVNAAASSGPRGSYQNSVGVSGNILAHSGGVHFSRDQGDSFAIVHVPGAAGASLEGSRTQVDERGYAVASNLLPYRLNRVAVDPKGSALDVEIIGTEKAVAPTAGAIVQLEYAVQSGRAVLLEVLRSDGEAVPLGAVVQDGNLHTLGLVGQGGRAFLRGADQPAELWVRWGNQWGQECLIHYQPQPASEPGMLSAQTETCQMMVPPRRTCERQEEPCHD
ncbi:fimbria/pilus outer membrane usher protein [Isoalcanivorax beigongshangi]|uniref:Fimbria/pilus outer membrane usher protein n=1 Tax=Isoalcanivorax beigongshangi TaxID=3238810 RepID=A0ABV4AHB5_9GAMM